jgi:hypothetical protein
LKSSAERVGESLGGGTSLEGDGGKGVVVRLLKELDNFGGVWGAELAGGKEKGTEEGVEGSAELLGGLWRGGSAIATEEARLQGREDVGKAAGCGLWDCSGGGSESGSGELAGALKWTGESTGERGPQELGGDVIAEELGIGCLDNAVELKRCVPLGGAVAVEEEARGTGGTLTELLFGGDRRMRLRLLQGARLGVCSGLPFRGWSRAGSGRNRTAACFQLRPDSVNIPCHARADKWLPQTRAEADELALLMAR